MIHLYQWPSGKNIPNLGPFCMKLEAYLRLMKIEHKVIATTNMSKSPKRTMPYVEINGQLISDSQIIMDQLEAQSSKGMDSHLSQIQKAHAVAYRLMLEGHLIPIMIYFRWAVESGWQTFSRMIFAGAPGWVRVLIGSKMRKATLRRLDMNGISRHSIAEIVGFAKADIAAVSQLLGSKQFAFGEQISTLDVVMFAVFGNILRGGVDMPLIDLVKAHPNLVEHYERVMKLAYGQAN